MHVLPIKKTAVMVFNKAGRLLKESKNFFDGKIKIPSVREYYYFGIVFSLTGSLSNAQQKLRSYFSLEICLKKQLYSSQVTAKEDWIFGSYRQGSLRTPASVIS